MAPDSTKKRGPRGLASSKAKKQRITETSQDENTKTTPGTTEILDKDSTTIAISGDYDEDDDVGQLAALYNTAITFLEEEQPESALPILNGTIHEADRILRNAPPDSKLSYDFHRVYASALLDLSFLVEDDEAKRGEREEDFVDAALERCELGMDNGNDQGLAALKLTRARCLCRRSQIHMAQYQPRLEEVTLSIKAAMKLVDNAFKISHYRQLQLSQAFNIIQDFADSLLEHDAELHKSMNEWVEQYWTKVLTESQEDISALEGCGRVWLSLSQPYLHDLDTMDEQDASYEGTKQQARNALETSVELLTQAHKCAEQQSKLKGDLLCLLAEATISLANTYEEGPFYDDLERTTIAYLKRAEDLSDFELPERFQELLQSSVTSMEKDGQGETSTR